MGFTNEGARSMLASAIGDVKIALYTSPPSDSGAGGTEVNSATGYARAEATLAQTIGASKQFQNHETIMFPIVRTPVDAPITHFALFRNETMMFWHELTTPVTIGSDTVPCIPVFDVGELIIGIDLDSLKEANPAVPV